MSGPIPSIVETRARATQTGPHAPSSSPVAHGSAVPPSSSARRFFLSCPTTADPGDCPIKASSTTATTQRVWTVTRTTPSQHPPRRLLFRTAERPSADSSNQLALKYLNIHNFHRSSSQINGQRINVSLCQPDPALKTNHLRQKPRQARDIPTAFSTTYAP